MSTNIKITMISNYINHHQIPFSDQMYQTLGDNYCFIQTQKMEQERADMGWGIDVKDYPYVLCSYEDEEEAVRRIMDCDLLIAGWTEREDLIRMRLKAGLLTLRSSERLYREGQWRFISPKGLLAKYREHIKYCRDNAYLLCVGAYVASDFSLIHAYKNKMFRFGYFPETRRYNSWEELSSKKDKLGQIFVEAEDELPLPLPVITDKEIQIVWAGRFMKLKHPEYAIRLAADLCRLGYRFHIHMIGGGRMEEELKAMAYYEMVEDYITFHGYMSPNDVRDVMEQSHIHLFTSNFIEGWGAVVNEGMNAGCVEIVNDEVGAAHYLIRDGENGMLYHDGDYKDMFDKVIEVINDLDKMDRMGRNAYMTILNEWNAAKAVEEIIRFYEGVKNGRIEPPASGPMSVAPIIRPKFWATGRLE